MEEKGSEEATITLKLNICLSKGKDYTSTDPEDVILPRIKHEISSVMQIKEKESGVVTDGKVLEWDKNECAYILKDVKADQIEMFGV